jgi:hypothetical protein
VYARGGPASDDDVDIFVKPADALRARPVTDDLLARATTLRIGSAVAPVVTATDLMIDKLMVLEPHRLDFTALLQIVRELREQVDWAEESEEIRMSPYARHSSASWTICASAATATPGPTICDRNTSRPPCAVRSPRIRARPSGSPRSATFTAVRSRRDRCFRRSRRCPRTPMCCCSRAI